MPTPNISLRNLASDLYSQVNIGYTPTDEDFASIDSAYAGDYRKFMQDFYGQAKIDHDLTDDDFNSVANHYGFETAQNIPVVGSQPDTSEKWEDKGGWDKFTTGVKAGWEGMKGGLKYTGGVIAEGLDKIDGVEDWDLDNKLFESAKENFKATPEGKGVLYQLGSFMPQMVGLAAAAISAPITAGTSLAAAPAIIGGANIATLVGSAAGNAMNDYDQYKTEVGEEGNNLARVGVGIGAGGAEYIAERIGLSRYLPKGTISRAFTKFLSKNADVAEEIAKKAIKSKPGIADFLKTTIKNATEEGSEEALTESGYLMIESLYKNDEHDPGLKEIASRIGQSFGGGALMGGVMSPISYGSNIAYQKKVAELNQQNPVPENQVPQPSMEQSQDNALLDQVMQGITPITHETGTIIATKDKQGNEMFVVEGDRNDPTGFINVVYEDGTPAGNKGVIAVSELSDDWVVTDVNNAVQVKLAELEQQLAAENSATETAMTGIQMGSPVSYQGRQMTVVQDIGDNFGLIDPDSGQMIEVPKSEFMPKQEQAPVARPIITEQIGKNAFDFTENEDGSLTFVPGKITNDKALAILEKEFAENPAWEVVAEKEEQDVPAQSRFQQPTKQTVVKSVVVRPKTVQNATPVPGVDNNLSEIDPELKAQVEAETKPSYKFNGKEVSKDYAQGIIEDAQSKDDLVGLTYRNDPDIDAMIEKKFPAPKTIYRIGKKEVPRDRALARIDRAKNREQLEELKIENDPEMQQAYNSKLAEFQKQADQVQTENNRKHDKLVGMMQSYNQSTPAERRRINTAPMMQLASELGYNVKYENGNGVRIFKNGSEIRKSAERLTDEQIQSHRSLSDYDEAVQKLAGSLMLPVNLENVEIGTMQPKEISQSILDVQAGKKTVLSNQLLDEIEKIHSSGVVRIKGDRKTGYPGMEIPLDDFVSMINNNMTDADNQAAMLIPEDVALKIDQDQLSPEILNQFGNLIFEGNGNTGQQTTADQSTEFESSESVPETQEYEESGNIEKEVPEVEKNVNNLEKESEKLTDNSEEKLDNQDINNLQNDESLQNEKPSEKVGQTEQPEQGENTPEEVQREGINEGLEKNEPKAKLTLDDVISQADERRKIKDAEVAVNKTPSEAQKEAGNYQKGHVKIQGFDISIENPKGSMRSGTDATGKKWEQKLNNSYGYFRRTEGYDGDQIDVFIGPNPTSGKVFVVDQNKPGTSEFDESKVMLGFDTAEQAQTAYMSNYEEGWPGFRAITEVQVDKFKTWLYDGAKQRKPFSEYKENSSLQTPEASKEDAKTESKEPISDQPGVETETKPSETAASAKRYVSFIYLDGSEHRGEVVSSDDGKLRIKAEDGSIYRIKESSAKDIRYRNVSPEIKDKQLAVVLKYNPAPNDINTWIRSVDDIKTAEEAFASEYGDTIYPDFTKEDMIEALNTGKVTVYSSYPIKKGVFVTPSRMNAEDYAGDGQIYSKEVNLTDIAWIDESEGQYTPIRFRNVSPIGFYSTEDLNQINDHFNSELQQQIEGTLQKRHTYQLGRPSNELRSAGIHNLPIELQASRLSDKSMQENHPFDLSEVKDLPKSIQKPLAVFRSATHLGSYVILTELEHKGKNYVVAIQANKQKGKIEINDIRSVHYRSSNAHIANWIEEGLLEYVDKKKMSKWISKQRYNSAEVRNLFRRATKIVENFENNNIKFKNDSSVSQDKDNLDVVKSAIERLDQRANKPGRTVFINSTEELPAEVQNDPNFQPDKFVATTVGGKTYINLNRVASKDEAIAIWVHENGIHGGLSNLLSSFNREIFGEKMFDSFMKIAKENPEFKAIVDSVLRDYKGQSKAIQGEEMMSFLAEKIVNEEDMTAPEQTAWDKIVEYFRKLVGKLFKFNSDLLSEREIAEIIRSVVQSNFENTTESVTFTQENSSNEHQGQQILSTNESQVGKSNEGRNRNAEVANILKGTGRNDSRALPSPWSVKSEQEEELKTYAKQEGIWFDEKNITENASKKMPSGAEADVYLDKDNENVIKIVNYSKYSQTPDDFFTNRIQVFNDLFPETAYNIIGFTETNKGFSFVVSQPFIKGKPLQRLAISPETLDEQQSRVAQFMKEGFGMDPAGLDAFENDQYNIQDLHLKNVIEGEDGNLYVIDAITSKINPDIRYRNEEEPEKPKDLDEMLLTNAGRVYREKPKEKRTFKQVLEGLREYNQDRDLPLRRMEEEILSRGGKQTDKSKPYRDLQLSYGRMEYLYKQFISEKMDPVLQTVAKIIKSGMAGENILPYLIAKHAPERNADMRMKEFQEWKDANDEATEDESDEKWESLVNKDYSGVMGFDVNKEYENPDKLASDIVAEFESKVSKELIDELWTNTNNATESILKMWLDGKTINQEQYEELKNRFKNFVPLRGWREGAAKQLAYTKGEGFSRSFKTAEGRKSFADNPLAYIQNVAFKALGEQVDNEVKESLFNLVINNYQDKFHDLYEFSKIYYVRTMGINPETGGLEEFWEPTIVRPPKEMFLSGDAKDRIYTEHMRLRTPYQAQEHEVIVHKPEGDIVIVFKDENLPVAQVMNKQNRMFRNIFNGKIMDAEQINKSFSWMAPFTNFLKGAYTSFNIVFPVTNFFRDSQEASATAFIKGDNGSQVVRNYKRAFPAIFKYIAGKEPSGQDDTFLREFMEDGGQTGFTHLKTPEELEKDINKELKRILRAGTTKGDALNAGAKFLHSIQLYNQLFEDATRFSVYLTSREMGKTRKEAAIDAKEASVNFNRKGKGSKAFDSVYAFWNVAIQSMQKNFKIAKDHPGRFAKVAAAFTALGFLEAVLNNIGDGDDDEDYQNISAYVRQNYMIIPNIFAIMSTGKKGNKYFRIPLPQFWRGFHSMGNLMYDVVMGNEKPLAATGKSLLNFVGSLSPIDVPGFFDGDGEFTSAPLWPTFAKPWLEVKNNRNFMGYRIANEPFTKEQEKILADSGLGKENVNPAIKFFTDMMFRFGGGDNKTILYMKNGKMEKVPPFMDLNPSYIEHLIKGHFGGTGGFVSDAMTTAIQAIRPDQDIDFRNAPFVNAFIKKTPEAKWRIIGEYYDLKKEVEGYQELTRQYEKQVYEVGKVDSPEGEKYKETAGNEYYIQYLNKIKAYDDIVGALSQQVDYKTSEGTDPVIDMMKRAIEDINELKTKYDRK